MLDSLFTPLNIFLLAMLGMVLVLGAIGLIGSHKKS